MQDNALLGNQAFAARVHISPPICLRRVKRLRGCRFDRAGIAFFNPYKLAAALGHGLTALVEITLDQQGAERQEAFEDRVAQDSAVQQCYRVSPEPDFVLVVHVATMPGYPALAQRLFTSDDNVRNVKAFFSTKRSKFEPKVLLAQ